MKATEPVEFGTFDFSVDGEGMLIITDEAGDLAVGWLSVPDRIALAKWLLNSQDTY